MSRSSSRRAAAPAFPALPEGVQVGLKRLVSDHAKTVAEMLSVMDDDADDDVLCEKCAVVMRQQQLSATSFLARFFDASILSAHAVDCLGTSGKGSVPVLAERIAGEWTKKNVRTVEHHDSGKSSQKRKKDATDTIVGSSKKKASTKKRFVFEAWLSDDVQERSEHKRSMDAAKVAWEFCDDHHLEMPSADWVTDTRYGPQECYNVMVTSGDWDPETVFVQYMSRHAQKGDVRLTNGEKFIAITKEE